MKPRADAQDVKSSPPEAKCLLALIGVRQAGNVAVAKIKIVN
jgi:hypothetical protein